MAKFNPTTCARMRAGLWIKSDARAENQQGAFDGHRPTLAARLRGEKQVSLN